MKKSAWIAVGFCLVLAVVYFATRENGVRVGVKQLELAKFDSTQIDRIEIVGEQTAKLEKVDGKWNIEKFPANDEYVTGLLNAAKDIKQDFLVSERKDKHSEFGVAEGKGTTVKLSSGPKTIWEIKIGENASNGRYVLAPGSDNVFIAKGQFWQLMRTKTNDWRKRQFMAVRKDDVQSIRIAAANQPSLMLKQGSEANTWEVKTDGQELPKGFRLDNEKVGRIADSLSSMSAVEFMTDPFPAKPEIEVVVTDKAGKESKLKIATLENKKIVAMVEGDLQVYEISPYNRDRVAPKIEELRDLRLTKFEPEKAKKMVLHTKNGEVVLEKDKDQWKLATSAKDFELGQDAVMQELRRLSGLRASKRAEGSKSAKVGDTWVEVVDESGQKHRVAFSAPLQVGGTEQAYVRGTLDGDFYLIGSNEAKHFEAGLELFRKKAPPNLDNLPPDIRQKLQEAMRNH